MVRYLTWIGLGLFVLWLIKATGLIAAAMLFLVAGIVPFVGVSIPPVAMFAILALLLYGVFIWVKRQRLAQQIRAMKAKHESSASSAKPKTTKKRPTAPARRRQSSPAKARRSQPRAATR